MGRDSEYLVDIVASARLISTYVEGVRRKQFLKDTRLQDSVIRRLEIIGEAAGRLSPEFRERHPEIPWSAMTGMRNRMILGGGIPLIAEPTDRIPLALIARRTYEKTGTVMLVYAVKTSRGGEAATR